MLGLGEWGFEVTQRVFGPNQRDGYWYFYAYEDGVQREWGPYRTEEFALGARNAIERRLNGAATGAAGVPERRPISDPSAARP